MYIRKMIIFLFIGNSNNEVFYDKCYYGGDLGEFTEVD